MEKKNKKKTNELCKFSFFLFLFLFLFVKMFILVDIFRTGSRRGKRYSKRRARCRGRICTYDQLNMGVANSVFFFFLHCGCCGGLGGGNRRGVFVFRSLNVRYTFHTKMISRRRRKNLILLYSPCTYILGHQCPPSSSVLITEKKRRKKNWDSPSGLLDRSGAK